MKLAPRFCTLCQIGEPNNRRELEASILEKRRIHGPDAKLTEEERALLVEEMHEEHAEVTKQYRPEN